MREAIHAPIVVSPQRHGSAGAGCPDLRPESRPCGLFANDERSLKSKQPLRPGLFVRLRMPMGGSKPTIFVREQAILTDQDRKFVYVVNDNDEVAALSAARRQEVRGSVPNSR